MQPRPTSADPHEATAGTAAAGNADPAEPVSPAIESGAVVDRPTLRDAAPALLLYAGIRLFALIVLYVFWRRSGSEFGYWQLLSGRFDSGWYRQIAEHGYDTEIGIRPDGTLRNTNLTFFPLLPGLIALVTAVTPLGSAAAGLLVSWLASLGAAWGIYAVGKQVRDRATGLMLVALWAVLPHALVATMVYTESLFTALAAWALWALLRRNWLLAAGLCIAAGLSRPSGPWIIAAVGVTAVVAIVRRQDGWRPWAAAVLAPLGYLGYLGWVGLRLGRVDGYFYALAESWQFTSDGGVSTAHRIVHVLTRPHDLQNVMSVLVLAAFVALAILTIAHRHPLPLVVYSLVSLAVVFTMSGYFYAKGRYLLPVFTVLLPIAFGLADARRSTRWVVLGFLACASAWYGTYLCLVWTWSP
jgi:hypothetical protein